MLARYRYPRDTLSSGHPWNFFGDASYDPQHGQPAAASRFMNSTFLFMGVTFPRNLSSAVAACREVGGELVSLGAEEQQQGLVQEHLQAALLNLTHLGLLKHLEEQQGIPASASNLTMHKLVQDPGPVYTNGTAACDQAGGSRRWPALKFACSQQTLRLAGWSSRPKASAGSAAACFFAL